MFVSLRRQRRSGEMDGQNATGFGVGATHRACVDRVPVTARGESSIL
jgi:hypothetical protein